MTEDIKKDEILSDTSKDKDKVDVQDSGHAPDSGSETTQDADLKEPSAGMDESLDTKVHSSPQAETAGTEAMAKAPVDQQEEIVEKPSPSPAKSPASEKAAATSEAFTKTENEKKSAKPSKAKESEPVSDGFKPHYHAEKKSNFGIQAILWILLAVFGVAIIGITIETLFINPSDFRLPATIVTIIWLLVMIPLWKKISLEAKVGLEVVALGFLTALAYTVYQGELVFPGVPSAILIPSLFCLMLLVTLLCVWLIWPRFFWLPIVLSVIVLLGLVAPVWALVCGGKDLMGILVMPSITFWPHLAGWIMAQIIFPFGVVLLVVLQLKNVFGANGRKHAGFILWALGLALIWTAPLAALDRSGETVFPKLGQFADQTFGVAAPVTTADTTDLTVKKSEPPAPAAPAAKPDPAVTEPTPAPAPAEPTAAPAVTEPAPAPAEPAATEPAPASALTPSVKEPAAADVLVTPAPAETAPATADADVKPAPAEPAAQAAPAPAQEPGPAASATYQSEISQLQARVTNLETEVAELKSKVSKQDRLIQDLLIWLADKFAQDVNTPTKLPQVDAGPDMKGPDTKGPDMKVPDTKVKEGDVGEATAPADDASKGPEPVVEPGGPDKSGPSAVPAPATDSKDPGSTQPGPADQAPGTPTPDTSTKEAT